MTAVAGRLPLAELGSILGVWAHPDDECYLMAGTALLAAAVGAPVACLTATAGEAGQTSDESRWPRARLADIRRRELALALDLLGVGDHTWLDLPDGGLASIDPDRGTSLVARVIDRVRPDTVLTFGPDGMTGHPDHVTIGAWATTAAERVMSSRCRVLVATKTPAWSARFGEVNRSLDLAPRNTAPDQLALHVELDGALLDRKVAALAAQASQTAALASSMGPTTYREWIADEFWTQGR